ncbi:hypothetical protein BJV82DRAFT_57342 [Fennellomyces sp. T-0311]|nr:hypothetical protein BJV82DRAFT_57342 [Fennellomyces sp. T-0311]
MPRRNTVEPCKTCKLRRKKCVRINKAKCDRCTKLQIECLLSDDNFDDLDDDSLTAQDGNSELQSWRADVARLNSEMQQLVTMRTNLQYSVTDQRESGMQWQLCITDGAMRLEKPITTMEELLAFTQASIRYLSPFTGIFKPMSLRFESTSISISLGLTTMIQRQELLKPRNKCFAKLVYDDIDISNLTPEDYRDIIDHLIPLYLNRHICVMGLLHVPTFLEYYNSLDDPLDDAVILAICIDALVNLRNVLEYSPIKKRILAETFYGKCKDLLFDLYNDPNRKLEVVFTTSFLQTYLGDVVLNNLEASRLTTVALVLCAELQNDPSIKMPTIQRVLFKRHCLYLEANNRLFRMIHEDKVDFTLPECVSELEILDDEPEKTKVYMMLYNHVLRLLGSRYITTLMGKVNCIFLGQHCEITLEDILMFEPIVNEWWSSLPKEFRLCDDPFDPDAYKLVMQDVPTKQSLPFAALHMLTCAICSSILQPSVLPSQESIVTFDVIQSMRKQLIVLSLNSCRVLVHALKANWNTGTSDIPSFSFGVMLYAHYCLEKIARCNDTPFPQDLLDFFKEIVDMKLGSVIPVGHEVPPSFSLVVTSLENSKVSPYDVYEQYPFAGDALVVDVMRTSISQLEQYLMSLHQ